LPTSVREVFAAAGLEPEGVVAWRQGIPVSKEGVYVVALTESTLAIDGELEAAPVSASAIRQLLEVRPELTLDGRRPSADDLADRIASFWLPDETIVYIGKATSLGSRVGSYYRTGLGAKRPHAGGWWLKVLEPDVLARLWVHYARVDHPGVAEDQMMGAFCAGVSAEALATFPDPQHPFPFANLEWETQGRKLRKRHRVRGATGDLP
jgi:hypothetical protein